MRKRSETIEDRLNEFEKKYSSQYHSPVIKWYNTNLSDEDKYRLGLMTYPEFVEWQNRLMREANEATLTNETVTNEADTAGADLSGVEHSSGTSASANGYVSSLADSSADQVSRADYQDFLASNHIDVTNSNTVNVDALLAEASAPAPLGNAEPDMDEILANVNRDLHGGSTMLSEDEIAALFAAANS